jgi:hypothetical protein
MAPSGEGRKLPTIGGLEGRGLALVATKASKEKEKPAHPYLLGFPILCEATAAQEEPVSPKRTRGGVG